MRSIIALALLIALNAAIAVSIISPVSAQVGQESEILIGDVGPGQTFPIVAEPKVASGGRFSLGGAYDQMAANSLPFGWSSTPSKIYSDPLQVDITVPKDTPNGEYEVQLSLWDEAGEQGLGENVTFNAKVKVTREVMDMKVEPASITVGAGQPARFTITIVNKGIAPDTFTVGSKGVRTWVFQRSVYIPSGTSKSLNYEVVGEDESDYSLTIWARSSSSDKIYAERDASLKVNTDLFSDYRAVNRGVLLFPIIEGPVYFVVGLLSNLLP
ncbi:TPA: hypothetical protein HA225_05435 [Candidatus Micrarchaeota archaeon]|nr:hypothetical protein [Candidatus Micrarchaeota archaeon]HIH30648.1 hypothetical protein [Candidatus Micrarchaeota archaeon]